METKPGVKTTEFFAFIAVGAVLIASGLKAVEIDPAHMVTYMALAGGYIGQRAYVKGVAAKATP